MKGIFTEREELILTATMRYKFLNKQQIKHYILPLFKGQSETIYYKVMNRLLEAKYVGKIAIPPNAGLKSTVVYYVTDKGAKFIERTIEGGAEIVADEYKKMTNPTISVTHYPHRWLMIDFWIEFDKAMEQERTVYDKFFLTDAEREKRAGVPNKVPQTKIVATDGATSIIPDMAFCIASQEKEAEALFFVEIDRGTETIRNRRGRGKTQTIQSKYENYLEIGEDQSFTKYFDTMAEDFRVLTVTNKQSHIEGIQSKLHHLTEYHEIFLFTTHEDVKKSGLLRGDIWQTIDPKSPKFSLAKKLGLGTK